MKKILVSECLYGDRIVRYDGKDKACKDPLFLEWKESGMLIPICPEVLGGLPVPRPNSERLGTRVVSSNGDDFTKAFTHGANEALQLADKYKVVFAILKDKSPSCGSTEIYDGTFSGTKIPGEGFTTEVLRRAGIKIFSEHEILQAKKYLDSL